MSRLFPILQYPKVPLLLTILCVVLAACWPVRIPNVLAAASQGMAGNLYDWGGDGTGALGDGTIPATTQYNYPVNPGVGTVISASDGAYASEIVGSGGQVYVAGQNTAGVIGEGSASTTDYVTYQPVYTSSTNTTFTNAIQVSGGSDNTLSADFALALRADGTVWAWGSNSQGQLGNNTTTNEYYPVEVLAGACSTCGTYLDHIVAIQAGMYFAIALRADGTVWAWGYGGFDSLGDGSTTSHLTPVEVCAVGTCTTPLSGVTQIATHEEAALALVNGTVVSWGYNINGALGNGTTTSSSLPVHVCAPGTSSGCTSYLSNIKNISMGYQTGYALSDSGNVYGWGGYVDGDLGNGNTCSPSHGNTDCTSAQYEVPTEIPAGADSACGTYLCNITHVSAGQFFVETVDSTGRVWGIGYNTSGCLGNNSTTNATSAVEAVGLNGSGLLGYITGIATGDFSTFAFESGTGNSVQSWGDNSVGELGTTTTISSVYPVQTAGAGAIAYISSGDLFQVASTSQGLVQDWGSNSSGELGNGTTTQSSYPVTVLGVGGSGQLSNIIEVSAGAASTYALSSQGNVFAWGDNTYGELGNGTTSSTTTPIEVCAPGTGAGCTSYLSGIINIVSSGGHVLALSSSGTVYAWGENSYGDVGNNSTSNVTIPVEVDGVGGSGYLTNIKSIGTGAQTSYALDSSGNVFSWGLGTLGELGNNSASNSSTPVEVSAIGGTGYLAYADEISGGSDLGIARIADGTVATWGGNTNGDLGNNSTTESNVPVSVCSPGGCGTQLSDVVAVVGAEDAPTALALSSTATGYGWGNNAYGNMGSGSTTSSQVPVAIVSATGSGNLVGIDMLSAGREMSSAIAPLANSCSGGSLSISAPSSLTFPTKALSGTSMTDTSSLTLTPSDLTGSGAGWNISMYSTQFSYGSYTLPANATSLTAASAASVSGTCTLPVDLVSLPVLLPTTPSPAIVYSAQPYSGEGPSNVTLTATITIPASALPGTYTSTWTIQISSGP